MTLLDTYKRFIDLKQSGFKSDARVLADRLIEAYQASPDYEFVLAICNECKHKLDHVIWLRIVLPELESRLDNDPRAMWAMLKTIQNLSSSRADWERLGHITEEQLICRILKVCPEDSRAKEVRIEQLGRWLDYTIHEWPSGVLYGIDGASIEECDEILEAVDELQRLDESGKSNALCESVREKTILYKERLVKKK